jgi:hypothetical protein
VDWNSVILLMMDLDLENILDVQSIQTQVVEFNFLIYAKLVAHHAAQIYAMVNG